MPQQTLLDIAKLNNNDKVVGLIEENLTYAPELSVFPARTIKGTSYRTVMRTGFPSVGFRAANEATTAGASTFANKLVECFILSALIKADKAVADAHEDGPEVWKSIEADGVMRQSLIEIGSQIFDGVAVDAKGFPGLRAIVDSSLTLDAGGTTAATGSSVYGVKFGPQGCQLVFGSNQSISLSDWSEQVLSDIPSYVASLTSWIGLQAVNKNAVIRLKDATAAEAAANVTDAKLAELLSLAPAGFRPDAWFMNRRSAFQLQKSRTVTINSGPGSTKVAGSVELTAPLPESAFGIPIVVTDSITSTEVLT